MPATAEKAIFDRLYKEVALKRGRNNNNTEPKKKSNFNNKRNKKQRT